MHHRNEASGPNSVRYRRWVPPLPVVDLVPVALASFVVPIVFLAIFGAAMVRRSRKGPITPLWTALLSFTGGLSLGTFLLLSAEVLVALPFVGIALVLIRGRWQSQRRIEAGFLLVGVALPWTIVWGAAAAGLTSAPDSPDTLALAWFVIGLAPTLAGVVIAFRGDPELAAPNAQAAAGQPGSRSIGTIAAAIREPSLVGPFGLPELAMLVAFTATWLVMPFVIPPTASVIVRIGLTAIVAAGVGTEAYIRSMPTRSRRAFEAFSWLGEWELARFRRLTGGGPPTSPDAAVRWLASHPARTDRPERPGEAAGRVEVLLLAGRIEEARLLVSLMERSTAAERFEQAACADLVEWRAGGDGDLAAMERAATEIEPADGDERMLAEVTIATAKVRRRMADGRATPGDAAEPFLEVRQRLGRRADGQVGRALRLRLIPVLLASGVLLGFAFEAFAGFEIPV